MWERMLTVAISGGVTESDLQMNNNFYSLQIFCGEKVLPCN